MRISDWSSDVFSSDLRLAERGLFVPPKVSASHLAPFIGGAAAKVNLESVLSGAMALGLAGPTKGGPHDHFHRRRAAQHLPRQDRPRLASACRKTARPSIGRTPKSEERGVGKKGVR